MNEMIDLIPELISIWNLNVEEDLNEELLNENIPKDLVRAYQNSYKQSSSHINKPITKVANSGRRDMPIDYFNTAYTEISKEEAKAFLGISRTPSGRASRIYKQLDLDSRLRQLRFIVANGVVEIENGYDSKDNLRCKTYPKNSIPLSKFQEAGYTSFTRNDRYIREENLTYGDILILIDICDKIYKTDEYDNYIPSITQYDLQNYICTSLQNERNITHKEAQNLYNKLSFSDLESYIEEYVPHVLSTYNISDDKLPQITSILIKRLKNSLIRKIVKIKKDPQNTLWFNVKDKYSEVSAGSMLDTGDHKSSGSAWVNDDLEQLIKHKKALKKDVLEVKGFIKHLMSLEDVDSDFLEEQKENYEYKHQAYIAACLKVRKALDKTILTIDNKSFIFNQKLKSEVEFLDLCYKEYKKLQNKIVDIENLSLDAILKDYGNDFKSKLEEIKIELKRQLQAKADIEKEISESEREIEELERQLIEKRNILQNQKITLETTETEIIELNNEIEKIELEDSPAKQAVIKCYEDRKNLMLQLQELTKGLKRYASKKNNKDVSYEENEELLDLIEFVDTFATQTEALESELPSL